MDALAVRIALARAPGLRAAHLQTLLAAAEGDLTRCLEPATLANVELPPGALSWLRRPNSTVLDSDLAWINRSGAQLLASTDPDYPERLRVLSDAPAVLFVRGDPRKLAAPQLAIVGARSASPYGRDIAHRLAAEVARAGLTVTSGLALGIDAASHEGALAAIAAAGSANCGTASRAGSRDATSAGIVGSTIAVFGTGLDQIYPVQHNELAARIRQHGAWVSELPPGTGPRQVNFPRRNRLISGLSLGTLVVEARLHSGSLSTARHARRQGRPVLALPGSLASALSAGCHQLIRDGARLVRNSADVLVELEIPVPNEGLVQGRRPRRRAPTMDKGYEMLLDAVGFGPVSVDILATRTGLPGERISSMLLILELEGHVAPYPGGQFGRIP